MRKLEFLTGGVVIVVAVLAAAFVYGSVIADPNLSRGGEQGVIVFLYLVLVSIPTVCIGAALILGWRWPVAVLAPAALVYPMLLLLLTDWSGVDLHLPSLAVRLAALALTVIADSGAFVVAARGLIRGRDGESRKLRPQ